MKLYPLSTFNASKTNKTAKNIPVSFMSYNPGRTKAIERELKSFGINANMGGNDFVAECTQKVVTLFNNLFGKSALPRGVNYKKTGRGYGSYSNTTDSIYFNQKHDLFTFDNMRTLKDTMEDSCHMIMPNWFSSKHPAHIFVHEFSHSAHWHHLENRNGTRNAEKVWRGLEGVKVPTMLGRLITRFKISDYAVKSQDMCEFMAERMTKDICKGISESTWKKSGDIDVGYSDIFNRKWKYRYSSPQSYIDYFTQQVWNGDIDEAQHTGELIAEYLKTLDAQTVAEPVAVLSTVTSAVPALQPLSPCASLLERLNAGLTSYLDKKNKLKLNNLQLKLNI